MISISGRKISTDHPPYIIAEMSANHNGKIENAYRIIEEAKKAGADAVKLQTYTPDTITLNCRNDEFLIKEGLWKGQSLYDLYSKAHLPWEWHPNIFEFAKKIGITIFSTPFDNTAVDFLETLDVPAYKIASFEVIDIPLVKYISSKGKPVIISTGMANLAEIDEAVQAAQSIGCDQIAILHCVSGYPTPAAEYNIRTIPDMISRFNTVVGISDHTLDTTTSITAVAMGASIIEKHFTLDRQAGGPDDSFSLEPDSLRYLCNNAKIAWESLGKVNYEKKNSELASIKYRRSLYFTKRIHKGEKVSADNVRSIRPGYGLHPKLLDNIMNKEVLFDVEPFTPVTLDLFDFKSS
jgi:pseudaminic acid synthase